ncbi:hypothetical protein CVM52_14895 [Pseudooceanicola lipolyticus]|uniref:Uncharacterized protein n=1 Tax=Pseudooceanicola lipolyticus TaxID=2029104 RepID=A0A2M8IZD5_9RHOB|nr:hypothetical protein [Pseudooceanicola lipolyticus]PJE35906.1 hypothetical protein CVM52_14895 [Pseudooceanicola lipolyticus]
MNFTLFGTLVIAAAIGYGAERSGFTRNGYLASVIICIGGAFLFFFLRRMFGFGFGAPGLDAILSAIGALIIVPFHWRR